MNAVEHIFITVVVAFAFFYFGYTTARIIDAQKEIWKLKGQLEEKTLREKMPHE